MITSFGIFAVSAPMRDQSLAAGVGKREQYATVYSGMNTAPFVSPPVSRAETRRRLGISGDEIIVGTIARLFHLKGHDDLLDLAPALCRQFPQMRFLWVGDGILRSQFESRIAGLNLADRFVFAGLVSPEKVPELTAAMDILVHPSRREGLARALPQGQLAGCPVVTYDVDGNREGLIQDKTGWAIPPFDIPALGQAIARLAGDPPLRHTMGQAGRIFALSRFATDVMVKDLEQVYRSAWESGGVREPWHVGGRQ